MVLKRIAVRKTGQRCRKRTERAWQQRESGTSAQRTVQQCRKKRQEKGTVTGCTLLRVKKEAAQNLRQLLYGEDENNISTYSL